MLARSLLCFVTVATLAVAAPAGLQPGAAARVATGAPAPAVASVSLRMWATNAAGTRSRARLSCRGGAASASGYLRGHARAACRRARRIAAFLDAAPASGRACSQEYGGPQKARIHGTIGARAVDRRFARRNGCEIADWKRAGVLLPAVAGSA